MAATKLPRTCKRCGAPTGKGRSYCAACRDIRRKEVLRECNARHAGAETATRRAVVATMKCKIPPAKCLAKCERYNGVGDAANPECWYYDICHHTGRCTVRSNENITRINARAAERGQEAKTLLRNLEQKVTRSRYRKYRD